MFVFPQKPMLFHHCGISGIWDRKNARNIVFCIFRLFAVRAFLTFPTFSSYPEFGFQAFKDFAERISADEQENDVGDGVDESE